jgi:hypothetical protein
MTTVLDTTDSTTREMSLAEIGRRIKLYQQPGWGMERATQPQLNLLALYCQKLRLLPGEDITLYDGKPWITVDGRVTLMRRHKDEYRGHSLRPLSPDEKELWGYDPQDIVVECTVRTTTTGDIKAYGRVSTNELNGTPDINPETGRPAERLNPLAKRGRKPVEMAMKRALARGERFAFGTAHDDEDPEEVARIVVEERRKPEHQARLAASYDEIFGTEEDRDRDGVPPSPMVTRKDDPQWQKWLAVEREARAAGVDVDTSGVRLGQITDVALEASIADLQGMIAERNQPEDATEAAQPEF